MEFKRLACAATLSALTLAGCSDESPKLALPPIEEFVVKDDATTIEFAPGIDILFVVDDSGSMASHQQNLATNISRFTSAFQKQGQLDYHIGVVTTDMARRGRLVGRPPDAYVERTTPSGLAILAGNLMVGTSGSGTEASFGPVLAALSPELLNGWNRGFYREDAIFAVVFITDAEDQSMVDGDFLLQELTAMKQGDSGKVLAYGAIIPSGVTGCARDGGNPVRLEKFLHKVVNAGKNVFSLCDPDFGDNLARIGEDVADRIDYTILLNRPPDLKTIRVTFGTQELLRDPVKGWSFDPERNAIVLGREIDWTEQPKGTKLKVEFRAAKYDTQL